MARVPAEIIVQSIANVLGGHSRNADDFIPATRPEAMVTEDRGTFKSFAKNSMQAALRRVHHPAGAVLPPKIAVPTRKQVDPSSIAISKSCDIPMESTSMPIAGSLRAAVASRSSRSLRK